MTVQLVFVDGPTGSGKDYFIEKLVEGLKEKNPAIKIALWRATDFVLKNESLSEKRKYTIHDIDPIRLDIIYNGHKELIRAVVLNQRDPERKVDLIIVNRSILTMLGTNLWKDEHKAIRETYSKDFFNTTKTILELEEIESLFIRIDVGVSGETRGVSILLSRIGDRKDNKPVDVEWFYTILKTYRRDHDLAAAPFTYNEAVTSGESDIIINRYFKSITSEND